MTSVWHHVSDQIKTHLQADPNGKEHHQTNFLMKFTQPTRRQVLRTHNAQKVTDGMSYCILGNALK